MGHKFRKLSTQSDFPNIDGIEVYKYDNEFDYSRYDYTQMELQICTVPWDMGEARVGTQVISGIGNVVYFGTRERRDAWFDAIPDDKCYRFSTKFKELHRERVIDVPIPYDVCARHNYLRVKYSLFANDDSFVEYEDAEGMREWFWFIREVEFMAPNTTRLHLMDDAFQTWIYDVDVSGMILERGHAPLFATNADEYLANPVANNTHLLTDDANYGSISQVKHVDVMELNSGDVYACIASTANPRGSWGTKSGGTWRTPASASYTVNGQPSVFVFAVPADSLDTLLGNITANIPQFKQTVQGVFFASADLIDIGSSFEFAGTECFSVSSNRKTFDFLSLEKQMFGYAPRYADIAKLYTSPYAHIEIADESGNVDIVKIEDTDGTLDVSAAMSIAFPFVTIDAHIMGAGGTAGATVSYRNISEKSFPVRGRWYDTLRSWNVPTFAVVLDAAAEYDYSTHFDREQRRVDYTTSYDNAYASAETARGNVETISAMTRANAIDTADTAEESAYTTSGAARDSAYASAETARSNTATTAAAARANADASADTSVANAALTVAAATATTSRSNLSAEVERDNTIVMNTALKAADNLLINFNATSTIAASEQQGYISAISNVATGLMSGSITGIGQGLVGAGTTIASTSVANGLTSLQADGATAANNAHTEIANTDTTNKVGNQTDTVSDINTIQNNLTTGTSANSAATQKANATRTQTADNTAAAASESTSKANAARTMSAERSVATETAATARANADRMRTAENVAAAATETTAKANATRTRSQAVQNVENGIKQAALREPFVFGQFSNGESAATKPIALFANIVTQSRGAIESAGDEFLRYGYTLGRYWEFDGEWNVGRYFTYWKLRDFWVSNLNVPDMYMDRLRFFLLGGVTIWRSPEDIGKRSIYDNWR